MNYPLLYNILHLWAVPLSRVWQAPELFVAETCRRRVLGRRLRVLQVIRTSFWLLLGLPSDAPSSPPSTRGCSEAVRCSSPEILIIYGARSTRAPYGVAPEILIVESGWGSLQSLSFIIFQKNWKINLWCTYPAGRSPRALNQNPLFCG